MIQGTVLKNFGGHYYVDCEHAIYSCVAKGNILKNFKLIPGDHVLLEPKEYAAQEGLITEVLKRKNELIRPAIANVDQIIFVFAIASPKPDLLLLDKLLWMTEHKEIPVIICFNKMDLDKTHQFEGMIEQYALTRYTLLPIQAKSGEGIEKLMALLAQKISVFAGQSGVGKSTLINRIMQVDQLKTNDVSEKTQKGRHTTKHVEFIKIDQGTYFVDTPGFSLLDASLIGTEHLDAYYPEFRKHLGQCKFNGCTHVHEPSCRIKEAVLGGEIGLARYERYKTLMEQIIENKKTQRKW